MSINIREGTTYISSVDLQWGIIVAIQPITQFVTDKTIWVLDNNETVRAQLQSELNSIVYYIQACNYMIYRATSIPWADNARGNLEVLKKRKTEIEAQLEELW